MSALRILCSVGTRPEAIKMAPVVSALRAEPGFAVRLLSTGQHRELLADTLAVFDLSPDVELGVMREAQTLPGLTARLAEALDTALEREAPDLVIAQGDTTSVFMTALACFHRRIPFAHVEAGLRTGSRYHPFPEEMNRVLTSRLANVHFAPTPGARANLLREGIAEGDIHVTGNTVIDALLSIRERAAALPCSFGAEGRRVVLMTAHRRENFGPAMAEVCRAVRALADLHSDIEVVWPVHPNPAVRAPAEEILGGHPRIRIIDPPAYLEFVALMDRAHLILTDSGGIQEEAPALGKPVLVFRDETERPEAVEAGVARLVGPHERAILDEAGRLLTDPSEYAGMARGVSPFGDGRAAGRIAAIVRERFGGGPGDAAAGSGATP